MHAIDTSHLAYDPCHSEIAAVIKMLLNHQQLTCEEAEVVSAGFSDCLVLEIARKAGHLPLGTFDKHLGKLDGAERL